MPDAHAWTEFAGRGRFPAVCRHCRLREDDPAAAEPCAGTPRPAGEGG